MSEESYSKKKEPTYQPVVSDVSTKKLSLFEKIIKSDAVSNAKSYAAKTFKAACKKLIDDIFTEGVHTLLYGTDRREEKKGYWSSYVSYDNRFASEPETSKPQQVEKPSSYDDILLRSEKDCIEVIKAMESIIKRYGIVKVSDLKELVGRVGSYTDEGYGWTSIRNAKVVRTRDGKYWLDLPKAMPID